MPSIKNPSIEDIVGAQVVVFGVGGEFREHVELALLEYVPVQQYRTRVP